jgi:hypothetical protein
VDRLNGLEGVQADDVTELADPLQQEEFFPND